MTFRCEDLPAAGLILIPPSSADYPQLLADIQQRIDHPPPNVAGMNPIMRKFAVGKISPNDGRTSAILLNHSEKSIAAMQFVWRYEEIGERTFTRSIGMTFGQRLLLPFSTVPAGFERIQAYWNTIFPGSKRYVGEDGMAGDNTDVRLPAQDEIWRGGAGGGRGRGLGQEMSVIKSVTLILDGAFFTDGEFAGPDHFGLWDSITTEGTARLEVAKMAHAGKIAGASAADTLSGIGRITGPDAGRPPQPPPPGRPLTVESCRRSILAEIAFEIGRQRQMAGDYHTVDMLAAQADTKLPDFRKH